MHQENNNQKTKPMSPQSAKRKKRKNRSSPGSYWLSKKQPFRHFNKSEMTTLSRIALLFFALMLTWITFGKNGILHYIEVKKELTASMDIKENLQEKNTKLRKQIARIQTDPEYLEEVARQRYYMTRENEMIFKFD